MQLTNSSPSGGSKHRKFSLQISCYCLIHHLSMSHHHTFPCLLTMEPRLPRRVFGAAFLVVLCIEGTHCNSTETWLAKRAALIDTVYGYGLGVLPNKTVPDDVLTWPETPGVHVKHICLLRMVKNKTMLFTSRAYCCSCPSRLRD